MDNTKKLEECIFCNKATSGIIKKPNETNMYVCYNCQYDILKTAMLGEKLHDSLV